MNLYLTHYENSPEWSLIYQDLAVYGSCRILIFDWFYETYQTHGNGD